MSNNFLYHVPQAFIKTGEGSKTEFAGLVNFPADYDKGMMFNTLSTKGGLFGGNIGHPPPCRIKEDQVPHYMEQLGQNPNIDTLHPKVKDMIISRSPWPLEELKLFISTASTSSHNSPTEHKQVKGTENASIMSPEQRVKKLLGLVKEKEKDIEIKTLLSQGKAVEVTLQEILTTVSQNQQEIKDNSIKMDDLKQHMEKLMNKKGQHQAFNKSLKAPLSIELDRFSRQLTILGSEQVVGSLGATGGPFGNDLARLRSDKTVSTRSLPHPTPMEILNYLFSMATPTSAPSAKSVVIIFIEVIEPTTPLAPEAIKYKGDSLGSDLSCISTQALKHFSNAIIAIPPASSGNLEIMKNIYKQVIELTDVIVIDLSDISKAEIAGETVDESNVEDLPIAGPGWKCAAAAVANVLVKALQTLEPSTDIEHCASCWGSHFGPACPVSKVSTPSGVIVDKDRVQQDEEICLRCLGRHTDECRMGNRECPHCGDRGHAHYVHEVTESNLQDSIRANLGMSFEFVSQGQANRAPFYKSSSSFHGRSGYAGNKMKRTMNNNQQSKVPRLSAMVRK